MGLGGLGLGRVMRRVEGYIFGAAALGASPQSNGGIEGLVTAQFI